MPLRFYWRVPYLLILQTELKFEGLGIPSCSACSTLPCQSADLNLVSKLETPFVFFRVANSMLVLNQKKNPCYFTTTGLKSLTCSAYVRHYILRWVHGYNPYDTTAYPLLAEEFLLY